MKSTFLDKHYQDLEQDMNLFKKQLLMKGIIFECGVIMILGQIIIST